MAWDAALKVSKVYLELLTDEGMVLVFEKGIRGGISVITHRHSKANNPYMKGYNKKQKNIYNIYLDMNNLYGAAMSKSLPVDNFKWDDDLSKFTPEFILNMPEDGFKRTETSKKREYFEVPISDEEYAEVQEQNRLKPVVEDMALELVLTDEDAEDGATPISIKKRRVFEINKEGQRVEIKSKMVDVFTDKYTGYTLMVDLKYPTELHDKHNDYPLAPERMTVTADMYSPHNIKLTELAKTKPKDSMKLVPNLNNKTDYVIHYSALKQCLQQGMKLTKVHKVISYDQEPWLKSYIELNTKNRIVAKQNGNDFLSDFYKLMNNSVFGKTMENVRNRCNLSLMVDHPDVDDQPGKMSTERKLLRRLANPNLESVTIFNEHMVAVSQKKRVVKMYKPIYCGQSILDISKTFMYDFHYNIMLAKYGHDKCKLLFTDTDSLCYEVQTDDIYSDMGGMKDLFDFSEYPTDHPLYSSDNCAVFGKMKDESKGKTIIEYVGLGPKCYALQRDDMFKVKDVDGEVLQELEKNVEIKKAKGVQKSVVDKDICFDDYKTVLFDHTILKMEQTAIRSSKHNLYTIKQNKTALTGIDSKRWIKDDGISSYAHGHYAIP
jgi:hypothetical protein